jgi:hypothetical protein
VPLDYAAVERAAQRFIHQMERGNREALHGLILTWQSAHDQLQADINHLMVSEAEAEAGASLLLRRDRDLMKVIEQRLAAYRAAVVPRVTTAVANAFRPGSRRAVRSPRRRGSQRASRASPTRRSRR